MSASTNGNGASQGPLLLGHSYFLRYDEKQTRKMKPYAPLGTLLTAAVARERGFRVEFFDAMLAEGSEEFEDALDEARPTIVGILEDDFNFLTKMCTLRMRRAALEMVRSARSRGCRVVVNGPDASDHPEIYLVGGAHAVILGEVEETFCELAEAWTTDPKADLAAIPGLAFADPSSEDGEIRVVRSGLRQRQRELDRLPFPAWDLVDVEKYRAAWVGTHGRLSWNMVTSRGCPYGCNWCARPVFGRLYTQRSPADVAEELARLKAEVRPDHVWFADDIFGLTAEWIEAFAGEVVRRDARIPFMIQSRVNLMKPRTVAALAEAGAEEVWLGVESGSQRILDAMEKGTKIEQVRAATRTLKSRGIRSGWFIQLGYLGERREDLARTRDLVLEERPDEIGVSVSYPLPGTSFFEKVRTQLDGKRNWEQTDDLEMLFHGTYTTEFYKRLRNLLHDEVDAYRAGRGPLDDRWEAIWNEEERYKNPAALVG